MHPLEQTLRSKGFLTINGLAEFLQAVHPTLSASYPTVTRWVKEKGYFKYHVVGGQFRVTEESIDAFVKKALQTVEPLQSAEEVFKEVPETAVPRYVESQKEKADRERAEALKVLKEKQQAQKEEEDAEYRRPPGTLVVPDIPETSVSNIAKAYLKLNNPEPDDDEEADDNVDT